MQVIQIIIIIFALFVLTRILLRLRENKLTIGEFLFWFISWILIILFAFIPSISSFFAQMLGIGRGVDVLIYSALIFIFYLIFRIIIKLESLQQELTLVVRELAIKNSTQKRSSKTKNPAKRTKKRR